MGTRTIINPNGTQGTVFNHGNISTIANPDGTHSPIFIHGNVSTAIAPVDSTVVNDDPVYILDQIRLHRKKRIEERELRRVKRIEDRKDRQ